MEQKLNKMRNYFLLLAAMAIFASCSTPKYAYHFDHYDYNAGKKQKANEKVVVVNEREGIVEENPLKLDPATMLASTDKNATAVEATKSESAKPAKSYKEMTKAEKKEFRQEAKTLMKTYIKAKKSGDEVKTAEAAAAMDHDLKLAAIFGAVGLVALIIGGDVFWIIGGIALIIGVVFFVMWLSKQ